MIEFRLLGQVEAWRDGSRVELGGRKQRAVLAALLVRAGRVVSQDQLIDDLWPDDPPARAAATVQVFVSNLRRALEPDRQRGAPAHLLLTSAPGYVLRADAGAIDAHEFVRLAGEGRSGLADDDAQRAARVLAQAAALWRGAALADVADAPFAQAEASRLEELRRSCAEVVLMVGPFVYLVITDPSSVGKWLSYAGSEGGGGITLTAIGLGAGVALSLMAQIGEQVDYLRFMPAKTEKNKLTWWTAVLAAGPGWVLLGGLKQAAGAFLAVYIVGEIGAASAVEPVQQFSATFTKIVPGWAAVAFALALMEGNMFASLNYLLGFYANCAIAWVTTVATDIAINKYLLGVSPKEPEFRRAYLYAFNPVGVGAFLLATTVSIISFFGVFGPTAAAFSPFIALVIALVATPLIALATRGRYYIKRPDLQPEPRFDAEGTPMTTSLQCASCGLSYERPDMVDCSFHSARLCSLCCTTEKNCKTVCHESQTFLGLPVGAPR